jgi:hypothetical protein
VAKALPGARVRPLLPYSMRARRVVSGSAHPIGGRGAGALRSPLSAQQERPQGIVPVAYIAAITDFGVNEVDVRRWLAILQRQGFDAFAARRRLLQVAQCIYSESKVYDLNDYRR